MLNLDTHILIYALSGELKPNEKKILAADAWSISGIVLWELSKLIELGRIELDLDDAEVERTLSKIHTWPISLGICKAISKLDFDSDPADEIIAATSLVHGIALVTRDKRMRRSKVVEIA